MKSFNGRNWWIYDRGDIFTLMVNDYYISTFKNRKDAIMFSEDFKLVILDNCLEEVKAADKL